MADYKWKPITPLSEGEKRIDMAGMRPLYDNWWSAKKRLQQTSKKQLGHFNARLIRRLSVETGILERLYDLDRGTTEALVLRGFYEDLIARSSTSIDASRLIDILRDQECAVQLVVDLVAKSKPLTRGILNELHAILTQHQENTTAIDQFGTKIQIPLLRGKFKEYPNNPKTPDGIVHEYCPPISVGSEIDNLLHWLSQYSKIDPIIVASWLHHRFTQIHPYQDGNGRLARVLTTMVLLRSDLLPIVVDRDLRVEYLDALESADKGELGSLVGIFRRLQQEAILQALSIESDSAAQRETGVAAEVLSSLAERFKKQTIQKAVEFRRVNTVALELRKITRAALENYFKSFANAVGGYGEAKISIRDGGPDRNNAYYYKFEVAQTAKEARKFANFAEAHYFLKASVIVNTQRLLFVVSFHHIGRILTGTMEATAFARLGSREYHPCSLSPFPFTHNTDVEKVAKEYETWLDHAFAIAIKEYGDRL
jgi:Fic family protein